MRTFPLEFWGLFSGPELEENYGRPPGGPEGPERRTEMYEAIDATITTEHAVTGNVVGVCLLKKNGEWHITMATKGWTIFTATGATIADVMGQLEHFCAEMVLA